MIDVRFFAKLRESVGTAELQLDFVAGESVDDLRDRVCLNPVFLPIKDDNIIVARNQTVCDGQVIVEDGDEIAFFPPVTGG